VAITVRNPRNIYVLNEIGKEKKILGKEYESWLWHRRMSNKNFDNLVKVIKREVVREISDISKPSNILCNHFL
jgi:hypothetical protein